MKRALLLLYIILLCGVAASAQTTYSYFFKNDLHERTGHGPDLTAACIGTYATDSLPVGIKKTVYNFPRGCGLTYNDSGINFLSSGSYTIELYMKLDTTSGYKKLIDFKSRGADAGLYNQSGSLSLYPVFSSASAVVGTDTFAYITLTRDSATRMMYIFANGVNLGSYKDTGNDYIYNSYKKLKLFLDDTTTNNEQTSGAIALLRLSNFAMDTATAKNNYTQLHHTLGISGTSLLNSQVTLYPNPVTDVLHISLTGTGNYTYAINDITGKQLVTGNATPGNNDVSVQQLQPGIYMLQVMDSEHSLKMYKIVKQ